MALIHAGIKFKFDGILEETLLKISLYGAFINEEYPFIYHDCIGFIISIAQNMNKMKLDFGVITTPICFSPVFRLRGYLENNQIEQRCQICKCASFA